MILKWSRDRHRQFTKEEIKLDMDLGKEVLISN